MIFFLNYFFFPLEGFANKAGSIWSLDRPLTEKSLAALSFKVPPHFNPKDISCIFSLSNPKASISAAELNASRSIGSTSCKEKNIPSDYFYFLPYWGGGTRLDRTFRFKEEISIRIISNS